MNQEDDSIIYRSNIQTDVVVVNQCKQDKVETFTFLNKFGDVCNAKMIYTTERGLSRSRNMAIRNCEADICLLADDDECFLDGYEQKILSAYADHPNAGFIAFSLKRDDLAGMKTYPLDECKMGVVQIFHTSSIQITFKRRNNIYFDELMGSGTGNGGGEENKFMFDIRRNHIEMWYNPAMIAVVNPGESQWFNGYDELYFYNHGWTSRRILGNMLSFLYIVYFAIKMKKKTELSFVCLLRNEFRGWLSER